MRTIIRLILIMKDFSTEMTRKNISAFAASAAFFLFLSMVPLLMALCAVLPYTSLTAENLIMAVMKVVPETMGVLWKESSGMFMPVPQARSRYLQS